MECYQRVGNPRHDVVIQENEVRITTQGLMRNYVSYATSLLQDKRASEIVLTAMGRAIYKAVTVAETIKRKIKGLYENVSISSTDVTDLWEPIEEGLVPVEMTRHVSMIAITLSKTELDESLTGNRRYQSPDNIDEVQPLQESNYGHNGAQGRGRGLGRGQPGQVRGRGVSSMPPSDGRNYNAGDENWNRGRGRGTLRVGRGYGGGGRRYNDGGYHNGGYDNRGGYDDRGYDNGGYDNGGYDNGGYDNGGYDNGSYNYNGGYYRSNYNNRSQQVNTSWYNNGGYYPGSQQMETAQDGNRGRGWGRRGGRARGRGA